jgi:hypothetical protein
MSKVNVFSQDGHVVFVLLDPEILEVEEGLLTPVIRLAPNDVMKLSVMLAGIAFDLGADYGSDEESER